MDGGCDIECVQWNDGNLEQCDEKCQNTEEDSKDESTCTKQVGEIFNVQAFRDIDFTNLAKR